MTFFQDELNRLEEYGLRRKLIFREKSGPLNFSSNDYLGLCEHPTVMAAAKKAIDEWGTGSGASRLLAGSLAIHQQLESELAQFLQKEKALVFGSGYHTNTGILPALSTSRDVLFFDHLSHASIIDGVKLSSARFFSFDHNNLNHLEELLKKKRNKYERAYIITEAVFSMDGDRAPIKEIVSLAKQYDALVYLDEAHSLGVLGPNGKGLAFEEQVNDGVDILVGTLSKTLASQGGFITARQEIIDLLITKSRSFIFSTALSPSNAAAAMAALRCLPTLDSRREKIHQSSRQLYDFLTANDYHVLAPSYIIPVWTGDLVTTKLLSDHLFNHGFFVPSIRPPTVPVGEGRVRLSMSYSAVSTGLELLEKAFLSFSQRPRRKGDNIAKVS